MFCSLKQQTLKQTIPITNGIFYHMGYVLPEEFDLDYTQLDLLFFSKYSNRIASELLEVIHADKTESDTMLTQTELQQLASIIKGVYKEKWDRILDVTLLDYDAIHNFLDNVTETSTVDSETEMNKTRTNNLTSQQTNDLTKLQTNDTTDSTDRDVTTTTTYGSTATTTYNTRDQTTFGKTETDTDGRTIQTTNTGTESTQGTVQNGIYGFNSSQSSNSTNSTNSETLTLNRTENEAHSGNYTKALSGSDTDAKSGTEALGKTGSDSIREVDDTEISHTGTITTADTGTVTNTNTGTVTDNNGEEFSSSKTLSRERYGNIGNIYTQDMVRKEIELRKFLFIEDMLYDVATFISLPIFG